MAINWKTPLQSLITKGGFFSLVAAPPVSGISWSAGPAVQDQWSVISIVSALIEIGPVYDSLGQPAGLGINKNAKLGPVGPIGWADLLQAIVNQAQNALTYSSWTGPVPGNVVIGWLDDRTTATAWGTL